MKNVLRRRVYAAYLRLTVDRNGDKIGYEVQREAIEAYAKQRGYQLVWFKDEGVTAAKRGVIRKQYEGMLRRLIAGEFAGIIVWRLDRLVRLAREFERCYGIVEDAKAHIIEASTGLSTETDMGKMVMRMLVMVAEMEISAMRERSRGHHGLRAKEGQLSTGGCRPFGFVGIERDEDEEISNREEAGIKHHPIEAPLARDAAERVAFGGATYNDIAREWATLDPPIVGTEGGLLSGGRVREILTSPRMAGYRLYEVLDDDGEFVKMGQATAVWEPIIPEKTWQVLRSRAEADAIGPRTTRSEYLFTGGKAKCGTCGRPMIGATVLDTRTETRVPAYRCNASVPARNAGSCGKPLVRADHLEDTVLEQLFARLKKTPKLYDVVSADPGSDEAEKREWALREIEFCNGQLRTLGERTALHEDDPEYLSDPQAHGKAIGFNRRLQTAQDHLRGLSPVGFPTPTEEDRKDIRGWLRGLSLGERRSWLAIHITAVLVDPVRVRRPSFDPSRVRTLFPDAKNGR